MLLYLMQIYVVKNNELFVFYLFYFFNIFTSKKSVIRKEMLFLHGVSGFYK